NDSKHFWKFPSGAKISFRHLQHEKNVYDYQGAQIPLIEFDEITHFSEKMFLYMLSRNRSTSGIRPYMRCTCNPDPDSFVFNLIKWWIDPVSGFPIPERDGVVRYFTIDSGVYIWGDSKQEVIDQAPHLFNVAGFNQQKKLDMIKSLTFIKGSIDDNQILMQNDPGYLANLMAQDEETKLRLLDGNWKFSNDDKQLMDIIKIRDIKSNIFDISFRDKRYITIDHARSGKDLCVIITWHGWRALRIDCLTTSDTNQIIDIVTNRRKEYPIIPVSNIMVDQDGIGVKDSLGCKLFVGSSKPFKIARAAPKYENKKTQCYFYLAERVNESEIHIDYDNIWIDGVKKKTYKWKGETKTIEQLIEDDLRTVKKIKTDDEFKIRIISKEEQKIALNGRSPDFGDTLMIRSAFDLGKQPKGLKS
ncbi:MAG: terminase family protein, partial [Candidatus Paceibacterota bacterium]